MALKILRLAAAALFACVPLMAEDLPDIRMQEISATAEPAQPPGVPVAPDGAPARAEQVSLLDQFPDACTRDQKSIGACHAFSAIAILEAAYYRRYKEKIRFSEADLFLRRTVLSPDIYDDFRVGKSTKIYEGNDSDGDIRFALAHGVATSLQYDRFAERYSRFRAAEQKTMAGIVRDYGQEPWYVQLLYNPRKHWSERQNLPEARRLKQVLLAGRDSVLDAERARNRRLLQGFQVVTNSYPDLGINVHKVAANDRKGKGAAQGRFILSELNAGRPVCVSMNLSNLKAWNRTDSKRADNHIFLIIGYRRQPGGEYIFQTRNSWGGNNPDVQEDKFLRIRTIITVLTPEEYTGTP